VNRFLPLLQQLTGRETLNWRPLCPTILGGLKGPSRLREAGWSGGSYVTLAFGTQGFGKRWFPELDRWSALGNLLQSRGLGVVWLGGPAEVELGGQLAARVPGSFDLTGRTSIPEAVALQSGAYGNVAIDTGLAHTAGATGRPTVVIVGVSSPLWSCEPLFGVQGPKVLTLRGSELALGPAPDFETHGSLAYRIPVERVANAIDALAAEPAAASFSRLEAAIA
jgi:ADP-heptose:LPS heptosyltransferase